jgi:D-arginine dehydrogenase
MIFDFVVIGGGISGACAAHELAALGSVVLLEAETSAGYHSTGRSAALFTPNYGDKVVRGIIAASRPFFENPSGSFAATPLLGPRGFMTVAARGDEHLLDAVRAGATSAAPIDTLSVAEAITLSPILRADQVGAAVIEPGVADIDVATFHQTILRDFKHRGGIVKLGCRIDALAHSGDGWTITAGAQSIRGATLINAAGAWGEHIGALAGARPVGLVPKRRSAILVDPPGGRALSQMPAVEFAGHEIYIKPEAGRLMASPGDETPCPAHDVRPDEMDIAVLVDWLQRHTHINVTRIAHSWAGLRSFVADGVPVMGFDDEVPDFFWLIGQGGYGIMMAQPLARATAFLMQRNNLPDDLLMHGVTLSDLGVQRCRRAAVERPAAALAIEVTP